MDGDCPVFRRSARGSAGARFTAFAVGENVNKAFAVDVRPYLEHRGFIRYDSVPLLGL